MLPLPGKVELAARRQRPSLRRRLLAYLLIPALLLMLFDSAFVYFIALRYSNSVHDRDLAFSALGLADAIEDGHSSGRLGEEAKALLEFNPNGRTFYSIRSTAHGLVSGSAANLMPPTIPRAGQPPLLYDSVIGGFPVRAASTVMASPTQAGQRLVVSMAETLHDRQLTAREILLITIPIEALLIVALLTLVWLGVNSGLRILDEPIERLAAARQTFAPVSGPDIPVEILPLTQTIDGLFDRINALMTLQERFVADAAHQLRTPLAGLAMHVERARASTTAGESNAAMEHIEQLTVRVTRTATQLLSLARAQAPHDGQRRLERIDLAHWLPGVVASRVPEALEAAIDLGYEGTQRPAQVDAEPAALQELFDNLIDNALRHVRRGGTITVSLLTGPEPDDDVEVAVDDDGPGVHADFIGRLGQRFFRPPGSIDGGSGLGLAIVLRIADMHHADVDFSRSSLGGLRVMLRFPAATGART